MEKYYRVLKDTFLWEKDAILKYNGNDGYRPILDVWNKTKDQTEYITTKPIENNPEWFERVYPDTLKGNVFHTVDKIKALHAKAFNS